MPYLYNHQLDTPHEAFCSCRVARTWYGPWYFAGNLRPVTAEDVLPPSIGEAVIEWKCGEILYPSITPGVEAFWSYSPLQLSGWYIAIDVNTHGVPWTSWVGQIVGDTVSVESPTAGMQYFSAVALEHLLDTQVIHGAVVDGGQVITHTPTFNERYGRGGLVRGNRSSLPDANNLFYFSVNGGLWTAAQILSYIFHHHYVGPPIVLDGQWWLLDQIVGVYELEGASLFDACNELIPARRGLSWRLVPDWWGNLHLVVFSLSPYDIYTGSFYLPRNPYPFLLTGEPGGVNQYDLSEWLTQDYDTLVVNGERIRCAATWSYAAGTLERGWTDQEQIDYKAASDADRATQRFERVYAYHRAPRSWNWAGVAPRVAYDGTVTFGAGMVVVDAEPNMGGYWNEGHTFERSLPWEDQNAPDGLDPEYAQMFAVADVNGTWYVLDGHIQSDDDEIKTRCSVRPSDREMGVFVHGEKNHVAGKFSFVEGEPGVTVTDTHVVYDYATIAVTAMVETDQRLRQVWTRPWRMTDTPKVKTIFARDCHYWYVSPNNTVYDVVGGQLRYWDERGGLPGAPRTPGAIRIPDDVEYRIRDDSVQMRAIACMAYAWYCRPRTAMTARSRVLAYAPAPGSLIVCGGWGIYQRATNTIVTSRRWDYQRGQNVTVKTQFLELDATAIARRRW
jgi:hypothetical protein